MPSRNQTRSPGLEYRAVILDQFALENEELLVPVVAMRPRRHAGRHAVDVKADAERQLVIELQNAVAVGNAVLVDEGLVLARLDIDHAPVGWD